MRNFFKLRYQYLKKGWVNFDETNVIGKVTKFLRQPRSVLFKFILNISMRCPEISRFSLNFTSSIENYPVYFFQGLFSKFKNVAVLRTHLRWCVQNLNSFRQLVLQILIPKVVESFLMAAMTVFYFSQICCPESRFFINPDIFWNFYELLVKNTDFGLKGSDSPNDTGCFIWKL